MSNPDIDVLNDVTKTLIDSRKGYEKAAELADDSFVFSAEFRERALQRAALITEFQNQVRFNGGEPETEGGMAGAIHRSFTSFSSLFRDDRKAALSAIDDGEDHLASQIESKQEKDGLAPTTLALLSKAHASARAGERFADRAEDALSD